MSMARQVQIRVFKGQLHLVLSCGRDPLTSTCHRQAHSRASVKPVNRLAAPTAGRIQPMTEHRTVLVVAPSGRSVDASDRRLRNIYLWEGSLPPPPPYS